VSTLESIRVLDLTEQIGGPYCTKLLAGFGAEVIKVENLPGGDPLRLTGPFLHGIEDGEHSVPFQWYNTGKQSAGLDLTIPTGREQCRKLALQSDVVVENLGPERLAAIGIEAAELRREKPALIVASITSFGQTGPYQHYRTEAITEYAMSGAMVATGDAEQAPLNAGVPITQLSAGMRTYIAILMALLRRRRHGKGARIDISVQESAMDNVEIALAEFTQLGKVARRANDEHALVPWRTFPCRNGHAGILGGPIRHWLSAAAMFDEPRLCSTEFDHMAKRIANRATIRELMTPWLQQHDKKDIYHEGQRRKLAWSYLADFKDVLASPQLAARGLFTDVQHADGSSMKMVGAPFQGTRSDWQQRRAPLLGEHTKQVLELIRELAPAGRDEDEQQQAQKQTLTETADQPLAGIRIIDFTHDWAGPYATRVMADYGAEVIKIEYAPRLCGMRGAYLERLNSHPRWWEINRNKASITLDLHLAEHVEACKQLIRSAAVIVDNSRPGVMEKFGLGFDVLQSIKADIIFIAMSAYGATGPESRYAGYGGAIEAISGAQSLTGYTRDSDRMRIRELDVTNGVMGACAVMTALVHRELTGEGQYVDLAQREATTWLIGDRLLEHTALGSEPVPIGNRHTHWIQGCYPCKGEDRWVVISIRDNAEWNALCTVMQRDDLLQSQNTKTNASRHQHHDEIDASIAAWTATQDDKQLTALLQASGIVAGYVANAADLAADPHLQARNWWARDPVRHDSAADGAPAKEEYPGFPFVFAGEQAATFKRRGPDLGEDNAQYLGGEAGWPADDYEPLNRSGLGTAYDLE